MGYFLVALLVFVYSLAGTPAYASDLPGDAAGTPECDESFVAPPDYVYQYSGSDCAHNDASDYDSQSNEDPIKE